MRIKQRSLSNVHDLVADCLVIALERCDEHSPATYVSAAADGPPAVTPQPMCAFSTRMLSEHVEQTLRNGSARSFQQPVRFHMGRTSAHNAHLRTPCKAAPVSLLQACRARSGNACITSADTTILWRVCLPVLIPCNRTHCGSTTVHALFLQTSTVVMPCAPPPSTSWRTWVC